MSSSENEDFKMEPDSEAEEMQSCEEDEDLAASATESDEGDSDEVDDDEDVPAKGHKKKVKLAPGIIAKVTSMVMSRHEKRNGKQLFLRFPERLPVKHAECDELVKPLSDLITFVHRPRQPAARFCIVDFATLEDRDKAFEEIKKKNEKIVVNLPKVDDDKFVKSLIAKKLQTYERKLSKALLKKETKKQAAKGHFTPTIVIVNAPSTTSMAQIKELFPDAIDIQTKTANKRFEGKMFVSVTFPTTFDAKKNIRRKLELEGTPLIIRYSRAEAPKKEQMAPKDGIKKEKEEKPQAKASENGNSKKPNKKAKNVPSAIAPKNPKQEKKPLPAINKNSNPISKQKPAAKANNKQKKQPQKKGKGKGPVAAK